eukprot:c23049_g1_i1 orf=169-1917(+)
MALRQEIELKRIAEDIHCMSSMLTPLTSLDANTHDDLYAKPHNFNPAENRLLPYLNKRHADDNLVKANLMRKSVGDDVRDEPNDFKSAEYVAQQCWKSYISTDMYNKALYGEKENLESGTVRPRGSSSPSKPMISAGMPGLTDVKRLQEGFEVSSKPLSLLDINVRDEINLADSGPDISIGDGKPLNERNTISRQDSDGLATAVLEKSKAFYSRKRQLDPRLEDSFCFVPDSSMRTPITESRERVQPLTVLVHENMKETSCALCSPSVQTMKAALLSQFQDRCEQESLGGLVTQRPGLANSRPLSYLESPPKQGRSTHNCAEQVHKHVKETSCDLCSHSDQTMKAPLLSQFQDRSEQESVRGLVTHSPGLANSRLLSHLESPPKHGRSTENCSENPGYEWRQYIKPAKTSLVCQSKAQGLEENSCRLWRPELLKSCMLSQLESQRIQGSQLEISSQNNDHLVVLFSVQDVLKGSAARIGRQQFLKLSSLCVQYSRKILSWITSLCRKPRIKGSLRRLQQMFCYSSRGFIDLNSQKLPEFSTKKSPLSSSRKLAKDDELKAVLMKINEVLVSMDRTVGEQDQL